MTLDEDTSYQCTYMFLKHYLRDYVRKTFEEGVIPSLKKVLTILKEANEEMYDALSFIEIPTFCVSWLITLFSHILTYQKSA